MPSKKKGQGGRPRGPRPFWSGTIAFGLVSLSVGLFPANRGKAVSLHMVDKDGTRLRRRVEGRSRMNKAQLRKAISAAR